MAELEELASAAENHEPAEVRGSEEVETVSVRGEDQAVDETGEVTAQPEAAETVQTPEETGEAACPTEDGTGELGEQDQPPAVSNTVTGGAYEYVSETIAPDDLLGAADDTTASSTEDAQLKAMVEAIVYITEEPLSLAQLATALAQPRERVQVLLDELVAEYDKPEHGVTIREVAGGYKMTTKAEHHETVRAFVKSLKPPLKLSLPALETLAVIAYKQPVTAPEIMEIRGVQGAGVLKTLLDRKLIAAAGRKAVIGKPILYKTTKDFLLQFGLKDLSELPSLKEFEEIRRMAIDGDAPEAHVAAAPEAAPVAEAAPAEDPAIPETPVAEEPVTEN